MTEAVLASARAELPGHPVEAWTSTGGPPAIQGAEDGALAVPPLLELIEGAEGFEAIVIACFDDTGLAEAKAMSPVPVIGIGEASYMAARLMGHRFSVVTTLPVSVPVIEANIRETGFDDICGRVRAANVPVLEIEASPGAALDAIAAEASRAIAEDDVSAIVLGCAGMTGLQDRIASLGVAAIDGVRTAAHLARAASGIRAA